MSPGTIPINEEAQHHVTDLSRMTPAFLLEMVAADGKRVVITPQWRNCSMKWRGRMNGEWFSSRG